MIFGLDGFTGLHVAISLVALASGFMVEAGLLSAAPMRGTNHLFLATTVATSVTGFFFPFSQVGPAHIVGAVSLVVLAVAVYAFYGAKLAGPWRRIYAATATAALYLNVFVLVVQTFVKNPTLVALAPTQSELPFAVTQGIVLLVFVVLGYVAVSRADRSNP
jgi:hypothetical protein